MMKQLLILAFVLLFVLCAKKQDTSLARLNQKPEECTVFYNSSFVLEDKNLKMFIDDYLNTYNSIKITNKAEEKNNFYVLYIHQNDFFTRIKLSYIPPYETFIRHACKGSGYFEYKGHVFVITTGLEKFCKPNTSFIDDLLLKYRDRIKPGLGPTDPFTFTLEADLINDTLFIRHGINYSLMPLPSDTAVLFKYMRSIKSFNIYCKEEGL
jgi:hypothetical protein